MPVPLDKETERRIIEEGGMSVDNYRTIIDEIEQKHLDMESIRNLSSIVCKSPARTVEGKAIKIKERIESEEKKAEEHNPDRKTYIRWMTIYDSNCAARRFVEIEVDEGANANFLTQGMAADRRLQVRSLEKPFEGQTINGDVVCDEYAEVTLFGGNGDECQHNVATFYILRADAPPNDPRIDKPIVGRRLLQEAGHLLLTEDPRDPVWSTKMGKESEYMKEQRKQQAAIVEAYQANSSRNRDISRRNGNAGDKKADDKSESSRTGEKQKD